MCSTRLDGSIRTLIGLFTSSLADVQMQAGHCLHELSHSSDPAVAEACLPVTSYLLTYLSGHSIEFTVRSIFAWALAPDNPLIAVGCWPLLTSLSLTWLTGECWQEGAPGSLCFNLPLVPSASPASGQVLNTWRPPSLCPHQEEFGSIVFQVAADCF